jgi:hypothetical protein
MQLALLFRVALQGGLIYDLTGQQAYGSSFFFIVHFVA